MHFGEHVTIDGYGGDQELLNDKRATLGQKISTDSSNPTILYDYSIVGNNYDELQKVSTMIEKTVKYKIE